MDKHEAVWTNLVMIKGRNKMMRPGSCVIFGDKDDGKEIHAYLEFGDKHGAGSIYGDVLLFGTNNNNGELTPEESLCLSCGVDRTSSGKGMLQGAAANSGSLNWIFKRRDCRSSRSSPLGSRYGFRCSATHLHILVERVVHVNKLV